MRAGLELPGMLSWLAHGDPSARVTGLDAVPRRDWPDVRVTHLAFQVMVALGSYLALVALLVAWRAVRRRATAEAPWLLALLVAAGPMGFLAIEAGWVVTEVGRQPWVIQGVLRTSDAVTPMPGIAWSLGLFTLLYCFLAVMVVFLLRRQVLEDPIVARERDGR